MTNSKPVPGFGAPAYAAIALLAFMVAMNVSGLLLTPSLVRGCPLLLLALRPTPATLILVGGVVDPITILLLAVPLRMLMDLSYFLVARHGAIAVLHRFRLGRALLRPASLHRTERGLQLLALVWASTPVDLALGVGTTSTRRFMLCCCVGSTVSTSFYLLLAQPLRSRVSPVADWMAAHAAPLTVAIAAVLALGLWITVFRLRGDR